MYRIITDYLDASASCFADKTALVDKKRSLSFSGLRVEALHIASALMQKKIFHQPIVVFLDQSVESIASFMGIAYAGNYYTVLDAKTPAARQEKILETLQPAAVITDARHRTKLNMDADDARILDYQELQQTPVDESALQEVKEKIGDKDILYVLFTSGSTGTPKGVTIGQRSVMQYTEWVAETFHLDEHTVIANQAPFYFDNSVLDIYQTLRNGGTLYITPRANFIFPVRLLEYLRDNQVNTIFWVPSIFCNVANLGVLDDVDVSCLQNVLFAGEVMPNKQLNIWRKHLPKAVFANLYGPTEITVDCTYYIVNRDFADNEPLPIGMPCRPDTVFVLNENNQLVTGSEQGELCVRGESLAYGYYKNPEKTAESFVQNPLRQEKDVIYRTGDLVHYNERGEIMYDGRKDFQIKHMGHRIELGEIEHDASALPGVERAACIYAEGKDEIFVFYTGSIDEKKVHRLLRAQVPDYMVPKHCIKLDKMTQTSNGKIDRKTLKQKFMEEVAGRES